MASRFTLEEAIDQIWNEDLDSGEFEDSTDESEVDSERAIPFFIHTPPIDEVSSNLHPKKKEIKVPTQ